MDTVKTSVRLTLFSAWRLLFNLLFWSALFTFVLGVRYYDIGDIVLRGKTQPVGVYSVE